MLRMKTAVCGCVGLLLGLAPSSGSTQELPLELPERVPAQFMSYLGAPWLERPERVAEEMPDDMLAAMGLGDGDVVADLGVGSGYHARRMARLVAPTGTVYGVDIQSEMLDILRGHIEREGLTGIVPVLSEPDDPKLPEGEIDWILIVDVYHELSDPVTVLTKLRQSLKPDGRVALVEYRVEDGTGDHIKADHRMSVRQVLSEWNPAGFELVELHEFLPGQHMFIFQSTDWDGAPGIEPRTVIADYDVLDAIRGGHIEVSTSGQGPETLSLTINRTRSESMVITFPVGTYFESAGGSSDMVASRDGVILLTEDGPQSWSVMVRKAHRTLPVPEAGDRLEIRSADEHRATRNVTWLFQGTGLHPQIAPTVEQLALWIASENAGYDDLAEYASAAPIPTERTVALAAAYTASAGIDITLKQIWADREKFVPALTDENLRRFFEN
ncbi:MAG TPA: class I SAM-dependent methyltransferase [Gemmatimonadetes bacterium]|nr:class I SAM-dependent methyltransferase [Gemmatimonadota bacterium]